MKKLLKKLMVYTLPFFLLLVLFFALEPYDYFALKGNAIYLSKPLSAMRYTMLRKPEKIILGDSRMANLNVGYIEEISGERYAMLGYGGAQLGECIDMFWFAAGQTELKKVVFGVNFYTAHGAQTGEDRVRLVEQTLPYAQNPFRFMTGINYWLQAINEGKNAVLNTYYRLRGQQDRVILNEDPSRLVPMVRSPEEEAMALEAGYGGTWHPYMEYYASEYIYPAMSDYRLHEETLLALQEIIDYCETNDIELIFVLPPFHEVIYERVVDPLNLREDLKFLKNFLIERATVYDLELETGYTSDPETFYDGFHLMTEGKMLFARLLFTGTEEHPEMIRRYIKDGAAIIPEHLGMAYAGE